uniref:NADH-ubiquinone oxidoreductase chain 5 n=1 Tax=Tessaratoma papillosa TaxID=236711 RepID=A0A343W8Z7_9HEMI|nr:NADH dehydrogenase subunit 5 [Tessaratoma papillosa]AVZ00837.1 NADH dehydrogenase subunit 5 [Tessaratoma papillosa]
MNRLCMYKFWSLFLFLLSIMMLNVGLVFLSMDYLIFLDWEFISFNSVSLIMTLLFDWMSLIFMGCVLMISSMVLLYSSSYMISDIFKLRFLFLVLLFVLSMMFLIISPNIVSILLGWDGLGLVSYCLVIYFQNYKSYNAGMLTVLTNRIGDVCILISISWIFNLGSWNYVYYVNSYYNWYSWILMLIVLGGFTKSAQIPFSSWLPAAMAAPTPVSALVHSSTLVTAGVYLLIRFSSLIYNFNTSFFLLLSLLTMFMSGLGANYEYDLKKIIALSTLSQLGLMMSILFIGYPILSYFHLLTHAFFKALLFLCAGLIIHCMNDSQDIRHMGMLINQIPYTMTCFCISSLSLCGLPFLSGFYSKDLILEFLSFNCYNLFVYMLFFISVGLTVSYSFRLIYYCLGGYTGLFTFQSVSEDSLMNLSMFFLTFISVMFGSVLNWLIIPIPDLLVFPIECKLMPLFFVIVGAWIGYECSLMFYNDKILGLFYTLPVIFMGSMWFMPYFSTYGMYISGLSLSKNYFYFMDYGWGEFLVSGSLSGFFKYMSSIYSTFQYNNIKLYMITFMILMLLLIMI